MEKVEVTSNDNDNLSKDESQILEDIIAKYNLGPNMIQCKICSKLIKKRTLQRHLNMVHKKIKRYFCENCDYSNFEKSKVQKHVKNNHPTEELIPLNCLIKSEIVDEVQGNFVKPKEVKKSGQLVKCELCTKELSKKSIRRHRKNVHNDETVQRFHEKNQSSQNVKQEITVDIQEPIVKIEMDNFSLIESIKTEEVENTDNIENADSAIENDFTKTTKGDDFTENGDLKENIFTENISGVENTIDFTENGDLKENIFMENFSGAENAIDFTENDDLKENVFTENVSVTENADFTGKSENDYVECKLCCKTLHKNNIQRHIKSVHENMKRFFCENCEFATFEKSKLINHWSRFHHEKSKKKCNICGKHFSDLVLHIKNVHMVRNSEEKPKCGVCAKTFNTSKSLKRHVRSVHMKMKRHFCKNCDFSCFERSDLTKHIRRTHI